ncbi:roadblock/LC7 domain-containing protein [Streptomyces sp. NPDC050485]|uniref:roadblock/LC7 domain-containing protein n=1 Tax=Streptomyces sp. NPDC050485 TaxID=3365617 RepID=UPI003788B145
MSHTYKASLHDLTPLLEEFVARIPGVTAALLATPDGLRQAKAGMDTDDADGMAALIAGLQSLARAQFRASAGSVRQVVIEHDAGSLYLMRADATDPAAAGALLAVRTEPGADPQVVGFEMSRWIAGIDAHLQSALRATAASSQ